MQLVGDIEANGLELADITKVHCLVLRDKFSGEVVASCADQPGYLPIRDGLKLINLCSKVYFHNGIAYDIPVLEKIFNWKCKAKVCDTLVVVRSLFAHQKENDWGMMRRGTLPKRLVGAHSLEAWGYRLNEWKEEYKGPWDVWTPEMQHYCEQDTKTGRAIVLHINKTKFPGEQVETELELAEYLYQQEQNGWYFDYDKAARFSTTFSAEKEAIRHRLQQFFPPWEEKTKLFVPKRDNKARGYKAGVPVQKYKTVEFNPGSTQMIAKKLIEEFGWEPVEFTEPTEKHPQGQPKVDEDNLISLPYPPIPDIIRYLRIAKRIALVDSWLKAAVQQPDGRYKLFGGVNQSGAVTHRGTHRLIANVPRVTTDMGAEIRELLYTPEKIDGEEWVQVGFDGSGLELRCLSHHLYPYDGGAYAKTVVEGKKEDGTEVHSVTRNALGLDQYGGKGRDTSKTWKYAWLYGAGDEKLGLILSELLQPGASAAWMKKKGAESRALYVKKLPALGKLVDRVKGDAKKYKRVYLIDGRMAFCRAEHSALNTLLQGDGAVIFKRTLVEFNRRMTAKYGPQGWSGSWAALTWYHDEAQIACKRSIAEDVCKIAVECCEHMTEHFNYKCPLTGEAIIGRNWKECH